MFIPASSEFVALCRAQVELLARGLGARLSAVYLTEGIGEGAAAKLVPAVVYPETAVVWAQNQAEAILPAESNNSCVLPQLPSLPPALASKPEVYAGSEPTADAAPPEWTEKFFGRQRQIVLPLMHEGIMMGLLVTAREDRVWNELEQANIQEIANTLAIACFLDKRRAWIEQQLEQRRYLERQQQDTLDNLLHQFRNPLTALRTFGKLLLKRLRPSDPNYSAANSIVRESDRLQELLQQMELSFDQNWTAALAPSAAALNSAYKTLPVTNFLLPSGGLELQPCQVAEVLEPLVDSAQAIAIDRHLQLTADIPAQLPLVTANPSALREILNNLIDNAIKYTPAGGRIRVQAGREKPNYHGIAISDTGCGIPQEDLAHLFERHYRGVQANTDIPGTGLGLAIAKELVEKIHGQIEAISPGELAGTTFIVWLPLAKTEK